ncbi:tetratricopeptide repeat protein [Streptomyces arboris]|uniref:tetratricopeptide repeat protein n=1 Tax=Streptomyces arboris TaxID=2600619 RepID=UPI003BF4BCB4
MTAELWNQALTAETEIDNAVHTGRFAHATALCRELIDGPYDELTVTNALIGAGDVHRARGEVEEAIAQYDLALRRADACGYRFGRLRALAGLGHVALNQHSVERAREVYGEARELARSIGDPLYEANALFGSAECAERSRDVTGAIEIHQQAHALYVDVASVTGRAHAAQRIGVLYHRAGRLPIARTWLVVAAKAFGQFDDPVGTVNVLESMGDLLLHVDETDEAEARYRDARTIAQAHGLASAEAHAVQNFGRVARARRDWSAAVVLFEKAAAAYRETGDLLGVCNALEKLAECRERLGARPAGRRRCGTGSPPCSRSRSTGRPAAKQECNRSTANASARCTPRLCARRCGPGRRSRSWWWPTDWPAGGSPVWRHGRSRPASPAVWSSCRISWSGVTSAGWPSAARLVRAGRSCRRTRHGSSASP